MGLITKQSRTGIDNKSMIGIKELLIEDLRFHLYQYKDGIIETNELLTKIEKLLNEYN